MTLAQDLGEHRQPFLAAILLVAGEQHDVLALARARFCRIRHTAGAALPARGRHQRDEHA
jgi:hypothetical protein